MGCCHPEKKPEESEILSFYHKMEKEAKFIYTIDKYEENYEIIINLSSNTFKKLKKKQQVRIGFVREIIKNIYKIYSEEKEEKITKRIVFYILILTLTLKNYLRERKESNISNNNNNDLEQFLLTIIIKVLNKKFNDFQNMKLVYYYLANMLLTLFSEIKYINQYFNIENYIELIYKITSQKDIFINDEIYKFIKVNLCCLGVCFLTNYPEIILHNNSINILIEYYVKAYFQNLSFLLENSPIFNKYLFFYSINSINNNKTINNNNNYINKFLSNDMIKNNNLLNLSNIKSNINDISNYSINQSKIINNAHKTSYISNMEDLSYNNIEFLEVSKTKEFQDIQQITFSLYSFLKTSILDTLCGKKIFKSLGDEIDNEIKNPPYKARNSVVSLNLENSLNNNNIFKLISLFLFNKCKIGTDKIIILSFLDYISDKIKQEKHKDQYYDILLQLFFLFNDEQTKHIVITLFSKTFIKDIENQNTYDFIEELFGLSQTNNYYLFGSNKMKILKYFLINISTNFKEIQNTNLKVKILIKLSDLLNKYIKNYNKNFTDSPFPEISSSDNNKYKLKKEDLLNFEINFYLDNDILEESNNYYFIFINYIKFYITFSHFLDYNFMMSDLFKELEIRKKYFDKIINYITQLEILSIQGEKSYVNDIIKLIKILIKIIENNSIDCFEDFQILCGLLSKSLQKISDASNKHKLIDFHLLKLSYTLLIFFLIQLKKIFRLQSSIIKIHKDIIECIQSINSDISIYLNEMNNELYSNSNSKLKKKIYQDLKIYLKTEKKLDIEPKVFKQILDIICSKLFGKSSSLFLFLEGQNCKMLEEDRKLSDNIEKVEDTLVTFQNLNFQNNNNINEIELNFVEDKDSNVSLKRNDQDSQKLNLPKISGESRSDSLFNKKEISSSEQEITDKIKV
jgi:hypothetical protein